MAGPKLDAAGLRSGEVVRVTGPNGSGKTSLLRRLAGLPPYGSATITGRPRGALVMEAPLDGMVGLTVAGEARLRRRALPAGLRHLADRDVATLSNGEARRVALALCATDGILLLDEPVEGLDDEALDLLRQRIADHQGPVVVVDHAGALAGLAHRTVRLGDDHEGELEALPLGAGASFRWPARVVRRARDVHLPAVDLDPGLTCLTGANGSGKTTLLRCLAGLHGESGLDAAFAPTRGALTLRATTVAEALRQADRRIVKLLVSDNLLDRHPLSLSAGEAQRVMLARTLGSDRPVLLLDEPEAHLDGEGRRAMLRAMGLRCREGVCILAASHDPLVRAAAHHAIHLEAP